MALKSPRGSAVTIMMAFCGLRWWWVEWCFAWELELGKELEKRSSVSLHWRKGTKEGFVRGARSVIENDFTPSWGLTLVLS